MILGSSESDEKVVAAIPPAYMIGSQDLTFSFSKPVHVGAFLSETN